MGALDSLRFTCRVVKLAGKAPGAYTRMYLARRRAISTFRKQLVACGVEKAAAKELARCYPRIDDVMHP